MGHGRIVEREVWCDATLNEYVDWPGCGQVLRVRRTVIDKRTRAQTVEDAYYITSAPARRASPATLLRFVRGHWGIETGLHGVRDGTFREDACKVTIGTLPQSLAIIRNIAITVHRLHRTPNMAAGVRRLRAHVEDALHYLHLSGPDF